MKTFTVEQMQKLYDDGLAADAHPAMGTLMFMHISPQMAAFYYSNAGKVPLGAFAQMYPNHPHKETLQIVFPQDDLTYMASFVRGPGTYGIEFDLWEHAVVRIDGGDNNWDHPPYDITMPNPVGHLNKKDIILRALMLRDYCEHTELTS